MLTSIWSMLSSSLVACLLASLGGEGLFSTANIPHTADVSLQGFSSSLIIVFNFGPPYFQDWTFFTTGIFEETLCFRGKILSL